MYARLIQLVHYERILSNFSAMELQHSLSLMEMKDGE